MKLFIPILFLANQLFAQNSFVLKGHVENPTEDKIYAFIYPNYFEETREELIELDEGGNFLKEIKLENIAYVDFNFGSLGVNNCLVEPYDSLFFLVESNEISVSGTGSEKIKYKLAQNNNLKWKQDYSVFQGNELLEKLNAFREAKQEYLNSHFRAFSHEFQTLTAADINSEIDHYYLINNIKQNSINDTFFDELKFRDSSSLALSKSWNYGNYLSALSSQYLKVKNQVFETPTDEFIYLKNLRFNGQSLPKSWIARILGNNLNNSLYETGYTYENQILSQEFLEVSDSEELNNSLNLRLSALKSQLEGQKVVDFQIMDLEGNKINLKSLKNKNVVMNFVFTDCQPCTDELKYLEGIQDYFQMKKDLVFITVFNDEEADLKAFVEQNNFPGIKALALDDNTIYENLNIDTFPKTVLLKKTGTIISYNISGPSENEGQSLKNQIEENFYLNTETNEKNRTRSRRNNKH